MSRNFGLQSEQRHLGGTSVPLSTYDAEIRVDSNQSSPRGELTQAAIDVCTLLYWVFFCCLAVFAVGSAFLMLGWVLFLR